MIELNLDQKYSIIIEQMKESIADMDKGLVDNEIYHSTANQDYPSGVPFFSFVYTEEKKAIKKQRKAFKRVLTWFAGESDD